FRALRGKTAHNENEKYRSAEGSARQLRKVKDILRSVIPNPLHDVSRGIAYTAGAVAPCVSCTLIQSTYKCSHTACAWGRIGQHFG
ncbi:MAG TPA: hypothetical protein VFU22_13085, partial [Roseiflexaceae bacterium]|nr:hypothetical protein [Roseiflexaceae bacterium]